MKAPERLYNVSTNQLSIARYYGAIKFQGHMYHYDAATDTLIRDDVYKADSKKFADAEREKWMKVKAAIDEDKKRQVSMAF